MWLPGFPILSWPRAAPKDFGYRFSLVGTSRCDVRAACSGATPSNADDARLFVPPATTRAGMAQRAIPTIPLKTGRLGEPTMPWSAHEGIELEYRLPDRCWRTGKNADCG